MAFAAPSGYSGSGDAGTVSAPGFQSTAPMVAAAICAGVNPSSTVTVLLPLLRVTTAPKEPGNCAPVAS